MSAQPIDPGPGEAATEPYEVIHLGGETAAVVPLDDLRRFKALEKNASPEALDEAAATAASAELDDWIAAGRLGEKTHEEFMAEILGSHR
ncbi:hypothetical protein AB0L06_33300 [Spirillospora sp. NPDC052269]